jgi:hypothetical protein
MSRIRPIIRWLTANTKVNSDAAGLDRDLDLARAGRLGFAFLDPQIAGRMNDHGFHGKHSNWFSEDVATYRSPRVAG